VLDFLIRAEQTVVYAYERALAGGALSAVAAAVLRRCLSQEREHVDALSINLSRLGTSLPAGPTDLASFELALRSLQVKRNPATLHGEREYVNFLIRVEAAAASAYHFAIEQLADDKLLQTASEIMANEAQHATVLSELLSPGNVKRAVPSAFVAGRG
jgi:rubrerythrin